MIAHPTFRAACACATALTLCTAASAQEPLLPDDHAPAGVMFDHLHHRGEFMVGYRFSRELAGPDMQHGSDTVTDLEIPGSVCGAHPCTMTASDMTMDMHMLDLMWAPSDRITLMLMPMWMTHEMDMRELEQPVGAPGGGAGGGHGGHGGGHAGPHSHGTEGFGDTVFGALIGLGEGEGWRLHAGAMVSAPTGSVGEKNADGTFTHYHMQLGSGTWDFVPSLTVAGALTPSLSWGAQLSGVVRLEDKNDSGYLLGDASEATAWVGYRVNDWLSASVRLKRREQDAIQGHYNGPHNHSAPIDLQPNYGGIFHDAGFGVNVVIPRGPLAGHRLAAEWIEPIGDDVNGYQLERDGTLQLVWSKAF